MRALLLSSCLLLGSCSITDILPKPSVEANVNTGRQVEQNKAVAQIDAGSKQQADTISNDTSYEAKEIKQVVNQMPWWMFFVLVFLAGWAIPTPKQTFNALVVSPIRAIVGIFRK